MTAPRRTTTSKPRTRTATRRSTKAAGSAKATQSAPEPAQEAPAPVPALAGQLAIGKHAQAALAPVTLPKYGEENCVVCGEFVEEPLPIRRATFTKTYRACPDIPECVGRAVAKRRAQRLAEAAQESPDAGDAVTPTPPPASAKTSEAPAADETPAGASGPDTPPDPKDAA